MRLARLLRHALAISLLILRKKPTVLQYITLVPAFTIKLVSFLPDVAERERKAFSKMFRSSLHDMYCQSEIAPCKGIQDSLGFWIPCCGFRIPAQWIPDSKKSWIPFFPGFNAFLRNSFSCSNLAILKEVVRRHNKFVFFFDLQKTGKKCITVRVRVYGIIMRGTLGDSLHRNTAEKNNEHRITAKKRSETPTSQFKVLSYD